VHPTQQLLCENDHLSLQRAEKKELITKYKWVCVNERTLVSTSCKQHILVGYRAQCVPNERTLVPTSCKQPTLAGYWVQCVCQYEDPSTYQLLAAYW
jgi:hypothetical protein